MDARAHCLDATTAGERLSNLRRLLPGAAFPPMGKDVNNHIHTTYSFSPYSPAAAAYMAKRAGLATAGIMDHDTIAGAREFLEACEIVGLGGTCGVECRVSFSDTLLAGRHINNPDQAGVAYVMLHAVPHERIEEVDAFFAPLREKRNARNRAMLTRLNAMLSGVRMSLDFDRDVLPLSEATNGGTVTERHLSAALARALEAKAGRGEGLFALIERAFDRPVGEKYRPMLLDAANPHFYYDLIGWIKAELVPAFYLDASDECAHVRDVLALSERVGAISAYAYLGDVGDSVTGDKRAQAFEDGYLEELLCVLDGLGFRAVTYMPARNTRAQLDRLRGMLRGRGYLEISGEDINQPRQPFVCIQMRDAAFDALRDSAWALVGHERSRDGLFSESARRRWPVLSDRVAAFAEKGKKDAGIR